MRVNHWENLGSSQPIQKGITGGMITHKNARIIEVPILNVMLLLQL